MQDIATAQCSGDMGHRIRAEHRRNPRGLLMVRAGDVNIRVDLPEARGRQILTHQSQENAPHLRDVREVWSHCPMFGLPCHSNGNWVPGKPF